MRFGVYVPNFRSYADPRRLADLARQAEAAGWDGIFIWDHMWMSLGLGPGQPVADPWVALAAIATATERLRLGPMVTPVARRRPWKLARELVTLDHLCGGRVIFGVGLGMPIEEYEAFGESADARTRAHRLDEGLEILAGLLSGQPFSFEGGQFRLREVHFGPSPVQKRIPVWVGGNWPAKPPFRRAARWDGVMPISAHGFPAVEDVAQAAAYVREHRRSNGPYDVVVCGMTRSAMETAPVTAMREVGATWWLESFHDDLMPYDAAVDRIAQGPPRLAG